MESEKEQLPTKVINLAIKIASKILNVKLEIEPEIINDIVKDMLDKMVDGFEKIKIKVKPNLIEYINETEIERNKPDSNLEFIPDDSLKKGDCVIETNYGGKDGTLENKLNLIKNQLLKE